MCQPLLLENQYFKIKISIAEIDVRKPAGYVF